MLIDVKTHLQFIQFIIYTDFAHAFLQAKHIHSSLKLQSLFFTKDAIIQSVKSKMIYKKVYYTWWVWIEDCQEFQTTWPSLGDLRKNKTYKQKWQTWWNNHLGTPTQIKKNLMKGKV